MSLVAAISPYTLQILSDEDAPNPREDRDNFGTMVCFHSRYNLGDKHDFEKPSDFLFSLLEEKLGEFEAAEEKYEALGEEIDFEAYKKRPGSYRKAVDDNILAFLSDKYTILPLYLYDHSGLTMNTTGFSCPWDSGQVGWVYTSYDKIKEEYGEVTPETIQKAEALLRSEVKEFDYYLTNQCYGFRLYENGKEIDSCWGFLGSLDDVKEQIASYLPEDCKDITAIMEDMNDSIDIDEYIINQNEDEEMEDEQ